MLTQITAWVRGSLKYFLVPTLISAALIPVVRKIGLDLEIYAVENERTVHHGKIVRIGGVAIFLAFNITMALFFEADRTINSILIGGALISLVGLIDDILDIPAKIKFAFQCLGALIVIFYGGLCLDVIYLPLGITIDTGALSFIVTFLWIVGATNAINFIDGLDGLLAGIAMISLSTISFISCQMNRTDVWHMSVILIGSTLGFWFYNRHPAKLFMGDCGAQFLGFVMSCLGLLGFKQATVISLGMPIMALFIPLADTIIAMIRRKLKGVNMDQADKEHIHHVLMFKLKLGHAKTVLVLHLVTLCFSLSALLCFYNRRAGFLLLFLLLLLYELFIEYTGMINKNFHPILGVIKKIFHNKPLLLSEKEEGNN